jgi:hypothetical protein
MESQNQELVIDAILRDQYFELVIETGGWLLKENSR